MGNLAEEAFLFALKVHDGQTRKDGKPYIVHPFAVANELAKNGADDVLISAGLLHDTIEDAGVTAEELEKKFGRDVLRLILFDTEDKSLSWEQRKSKTLGMLETCDRECAMLVCADKLANIKDVQSDMETLGESIWNRFARGKEKQEWLYREYVTVLSRLSDLKMYFDLKSAVNTVFEKRGNNTMQTKITVKDNMTYATVAGNINSANAQEFGDALSCAPGETDGVIIDAYALEYISSAGLRVMLSVKKRCGSRTFRIVNVSADVMSIFDVTGFSDIMDIVPASRKISVEGCEVIGRGACGECYRIDDETIIKLYYDNTDTKWIEHEKALAKKAFVMGIPTAISYDIVEANGRKGVVYELIKSKTLGELIRANPDKLDDYADMYADVCKKIHAIHTDDPDIPSFKEQNRADIQNISGITEEEKKYLNRFLDLVPDGDTCIHGDLNINNIMVQDGECCLIDMGELSTGTPMFDLSRILFSMVYAAPSQEEYYSFYKMPTEKVTEIFNKFFRGYFGCNTSEEAEKTYPEAKWLHPLAWFRCCTSMLKGDRWPPEKRELARDLLKNKLIPFVQSIEEK